MAIKDYPYLIIASVYHALQMIASRKITTVCDPSQEKIVYSIAWLLVLLYPTKNILLIVKSLSAI